MNGYPKLYVIFCSIFCTIIITGNLIFQKFVTLNIFGYYLEVSVGVLFYPLTFLLSDLVIEFYGKLAARFMINMAVLCSLIVFVLVAIAGYTDATKWSVIDNQTFDKVFNAYEIAAITSIAANYLGQRFNIQVFAYLKELTKGKHLWFRNNVSTILGQTLDTFIVVFVLCLFLIIPWNKFIIVALSSLSFKALAALLDTPFCYLGCYFIRKFDLAKTI